MKYIIAVLVISTGALASEPKKIIIPRQESKRITLRRSGLSVREALNEMAALKIHDYQSMKAIERAQAQMKKIERDKKNQHMLFAIRDMGQ